MLVQATRYTVTVLPAGYESHDDWHFFVVTVQYRGGGRWAVYKGAYEYSSLPSALSATGEWDMEGSQEREDPGWLDTHRFDLDTALGLAKEVAPAVGIYSHRDKKFITATEVAKEIRSDTGRHHAP